MPQTVKKTQPLSVPNGQAVERQSVPVLPVAEFRQSILRAVHGGARIAALFGQGSPNGQGQVDGQGGSCGLVRLWAVLAHADQGLLSVLAADVGDSYPALTPECPQAHWFEREIAEQWSVQPVGHPWLKPIRFEPSRRPGHDLWDRDGEILPGDAKFFQVLGQEIHEVAVGPVHAGIIEPGHFRFQCHGENVFHLEISLGYQHRGVERAMLGGPTGRSIHYMETLAGDTTVGHAWAYCQALEALAEGHVSARAQALRGVALELERVANHVGDLGALAGDVAFLPTASYCGRIRGDILNMTGLICGNRFGRRLVRPGGVSFDVDAAMAEELLKRLQAARKDLESSVNLLWGTASVMARFEDTGTLSLQTCQQIGLVGPAARACGADRDVRNDFPFGIFRFTHIPVCTWHTGDVFARAYVRWMEIQRSLAFVEEQLRQLPEGSLREKLSPLAGDRLVVSLVEGWRGEICHVALTDAQGKLAGYKVVDPSFHNWFGLACALRNQQISDFPVCNKSFNLSYCGHDL